jgi:hypothetical protein
VILVVTAFLSTLVIWWLGSKVLDRFFPRRSMSALFVEGGHYLVRYENVSGRSMRGVVIVRQISQDERAVLVSLGVDRAPGDATEAAWYEAKVFRILSVLRAPPTLEAGDARGSYRGE